METRDGKKYLEYCKIRNKVRALTRKLQKAFERNDANQTKRTQKPSGNIINPKLQSKQELVN